MPYDGVTNCKVANWGSRRANRFSFRSALNNNTFLLQYQPSPVAHVRMEIPLPGVDFCCELLPSSELA